MQPVKRVLQKMAAALMIVSLISPGPAFSQEKSGEPAVDEASRVQMETLVSIAADDVPAAGDEEIPLAPKQRLPPDEAFQQVVSVDLRGMDVIEALRYISTKSGVNIIATRGVTGRVTMTLEDVAIKDIFDLILRSNGLAYLRQGDVYQVMSEAEYRALFGRSFSDMRKVKVLRLRYAIPEQAFSMLDALKSEVGRVLVDQESGNVLIMDTESQIERLEQALSEFERENLVEIFVLKYAKSKDVEEILKTRLDLKRVGSVKSDERNNQVIVQTFGDRMEEVRRIIESLDKPDKQVLIETKIVKIKLSDQMDTGIEWEGIFAATKEYGTGYVGSAPFTYIPAGSSTPSFSTRTDWYLHEGQQIGSYPFSATTSSLNTSLKTTLGEKLHFGIFDGKKDFDVLMNLVKTLGQTRVLANPKLVVLNKQEAKIHIGEKQAYVTTTTTSGQTTSTIAEEVTFVDVGIQLSVAPTINDDGYVLMKIKPEISNVGATLITPTKNQIPIIDTTLAETTVMMKDHTTLLIGGLRKEEKAHNSERFPFLAELPLFGFFFKQAKDKTDRTEILIMITPHIISGNDFTVGDDRAFGDAQYTYQDYESLVNDRRMFPGGSPAGIEPKSYRDYTIFDEQVDGAPMIKDVIKR